MQVCIKDWFFQIFPCERFFLILFYSVWKLVFYKIWNIWICQCYCFCTRFSTFLQFLVLLKLFNTQHNIHSILFFSILFYSILFYSILFYSILFYSFLFMSLKVLKFWSFIAFLQMLSKIFGKKTCPRFEGWFE